MSTRSVILISDGETFIRLYKHCDGYPTHNLEVILAGLVASDDEHEIVTPSARGYLSAGDLAQLIVDQQVGAQVEFRGLPDDPDRYGRQCDLEWVYSIDCGNDREVRVYGGNDDPLGIIAGGLDDPTSYADQLSEEYRKDECETIEAVVARIRGIGWTLNGS